MSRAHLRGLGWLALIGALACVGWSQRSTFQRAWRRTTGPKPAPLIVVLPLESAGDEPADSFFASGLTQDLIARLGQTSGLKVFGRSGTSRSKEYPIATLTNELGARVAVTGSARRSASGVTISLELIRGSDQASLWANTFSGNSEDIVALETKAAGQLAKVLRVEDQPTSAATRLWSRKVDARAFELYLRGEDALVHQHATEAIRFFEQATAADGSLVEAFAGLVEALHAVDVNEGIPDDPARTARMRAAAERAFQLDPDLAQANLAKGLAAPSLERALAALNRAIELDPSYARALEALGDAVLDFDPDRAIAFYGRAQTADPFLETAHLNQATALLLLNRWGLTRAELLRTRYEYAPEWGLVLFPVLDVAQGKYGDAFADLVVKTPNMRDRSFFLAQYVSALAGGHKTAEALEEARSLTARFPDLCEGHALLAGVLSDQGKAAEARQAARPLLTAAEGDAARESTLRCAATAAAALGDGAQTAALLDRILTRDEWLRSWSFPRFGQSGRLLLMGHVYPWTKVVDLPSVAAARARMTAAIDRAHDIVTAALGPVAYQ